jgi:GT2 family glycosyltransferase
MKDLNITLVNYYYKSDIPQALRSVFKDLENCPYDVQVTVVDNSNNEDGIGKVLHDEYPQVQYINAKKNIGFGKGTALGFKQTPARYYFALNRDTIIPENSRVIERIIKFMDAHPKIGCMGTKLVYMDGTLQSSCFRFDRGSMLVKPFKQLNWDKKYKWAKKITSQLSMEDFDHNETRPVDWVLGAAMMVRHEVAEQVGWFDERYFMYLEDCDWCKTMWEAGWPVYYVHDIVIKHRHARESAKVPGALKALFKNKLARYHLISWLKYLWKWRGSHKYYGKVS